MRENPRRPEEPSHPALAASMLMLGVVILLVVVAALEVVS